MVTARQASILRAAVSLDTARQALYEARRQICIPEEDVRQIELLVAEIDVLFTRLIPKEGPT